MKTITNHLKELIKIRYGGFDTLVLKGFENNTLQEISTEMPHVTGSLPFDDKQKLDLSKIKSSFTRILAGINNATAELPLLFEFESFIQLAQNINLDELNKKFLVITNNLIYEYPNQSNVSAEDFEELINANKEIPEVSLFHSFYANAIAYKNNVLIQYIDGITDEFECVKNINLFEKAEPDFIRISGEAELEVDHHFQFQPLSQDYLDLKIKIFQGVVFDSLIMSVDDTIKQQNKSMDELRQFTGAIKSLGVKTTFYIQDIRIREEFRPELNKILMQFWGSHDFRKFQIYKDPDINTDLMQVSQAAVIEEVIQQYENGQKGDFIRDIFLTAPTGSGKSLLFQLPAIYLAEKYNAVTIVISPLIALMKDQVIALQNDRKYLNVAYINSELSLIDREDILNKVYDGEISVLYLSPELLLSYDLRTFIGERTLGLLVIDEAHLVTTWGRDFRVDYWYLGNYIKKIRKYYDYKFPVLAVTATAVYNGPNDMAFETLDSLSMENAIMYIGKVIRNEITFDVHEMNIEGVHEREKIINTARRIEEFHKNGEKTIVYCPWTNQLHPILDQIDSAEKANIGLYFGGLNKEIKNETYEQFKNNDVKTIISTKAFGMGVDIDDITTVYHHAPSGHLTDYVQEIGRLARRKGIQGVAKIDFNRRDLKYTKILYGLSSIKQFQLSMMLDKLLKIFEIKKKRNLVVSIEDFEYVFNSDNVDVEQKVKSSLLLLEKDLLIKHQYNILIARPKNLFTHVFARINKEQKETFCTKYSGLCNHISNEHIESKGQEVFKIELDKVWEKYYSERSFPQIKREYFEKTLFESDGIYVSPQIRLEYNLNSSSKEIFDKLTQLFQIVENSLREMGGGFFTKNQFAKSLNSKFDDKLLAKRISDLILSIYSSRVIARGRNFSFEKPECFIQQKRENHEYLYRVFQRDYPKVKSAMRRRFHRMFGHMYLNQRQQVFYIPVNNEKNIGMIQLGYVLEAFDLATYEVAGGEKPGVFIRINDPVKLKRILKKGYTNSILQDIDRRQQTSVQIMEYFFTHDLSNEERWNFIEEYFLGKTAEELMNIDINLNSQ